MALTKAKLIELIDNGDIDVRAASIAADMNRITFLSKEPTGVDDTQLLNDALNNVTDGGMLKIPQGTYLYNGKFSREFLEGVTIEGDKGTIIDCRNNPNVNPSDVLFTLKGKRNEYTPLLDDVTKNSYSIKSNLNVGKGDVVLISTSDRWNSEIGDTQYISGEMAQVESKVGSTITLLSPLYDSYNAYEEGSGDYTRVYKLSMPKITIRNITILCDAPNVAMEVSYAKNLFIENVEITGARQKCLMCSYIYKGHINACYFDDCWYSGTGQSYGLNMNTSQHISVTNNRIFGGRHGVAFGGWEPFRDITFIGNTVDSHRSGGSNCVDFHGNCDIVHVSNNEVLNGIVMQGAINYKIHDNNIKRVAPANFGIHLYITKSMDYAFIHNNSIETISNDTFGLCVDFRSPDLTIDSLNISSNYIKTNATAIYFNPRHTGNRVNTFICNDNTLISELLAIRCGAVSGNMVIFKEIQINGGYYYSNNSITPILFSGSGTERVTISNVKVESKAVDSVGINVSNVSKVIMDNVYLTNTGVSPGRNSVIACDYLIVKNTIFENFRLLGGLQTTVSTLVLEKDNIQINSVGSITHTGTGQVNPAS